MGRIKALIIDVDGTLTDGKIYMGSSGEVCKAFNIKDGYGIHDILLPHGIIPIIITGRNSQIVSSRCIELGITEIHQGVSDKTSKLKEVLDRLEIEYKDVAYIGDDLNDLLCMKIIKADGGIVGSPQNAASGVKEIADYISDFNGGDGAVRDFIEWIIK